MSAKAPSYALAHRNEHLVAHRRMILGRAIAASAAGLIPVPFVDSWVPSLIRRGTIRRLAEARGVDLDETAVRAVADGHEAAPGWRTLVGAIPLGRLVGRAFRTALLSYSLYRRADEANRVFALTTLFDHYCARVHVGHGLDGPAGTALRKRIDRALAASPRRIGLDMFRRGFVLAGRAVVRAPFELADLASGGRIRKRLAARDETIAEEIAEEALAEPPPEGSFLARAYHAVDRQMSAAGRAYLEGLVDAFDQAEEETT